MSNENYQAPSEPVTREEVYYDAILRGLNGDSPAPVIPAPVWRTEEYLAAIAEAASSGGGSNNLFLVTMPTYNTTDKTYDETVAAVEAGKTVMVLWNSRYYSFLERSSDKLYFVGNGSNSTSASFGKLDLIIFSKTSISAGNTFRFLNKPLAAANGSELIVKDSEWAMQQKKFIVTLTPTALDYSGTMDKTANEITAAYEAGQEIVFNVVGFPGFDHVYIPAAWCTYATDNPCCSASATLVEIGSNMQIIIWTTDADNGTTYGTQIYTLTPAS